MSKEINKLCEYLQSREDSSDWVVIITSDHGGIARNHGGDTDEETFTPFIVYGNNIRVGYDFTAKGMNQCDCTSIMAGILGYELPDNWQGRDINYFEILSKK